MSLFTILSDGVDFEKYCYIPEDDIVDLEDNAHILKRIVGSLVDTKQGIEGLRALKGWRAALHNPDTKFTLTAFKRKRKQNVRDAESWFSSDIREFFEKNG